MTKEEESDLRSRLARMSKTGLVDRCVQLENWVDALQEGWGKAMERMSGLRAEPASSAFPWAGRRDGRSNPRKKKPAADKDASHTKGE